MENININNLTRNILNKSNSIIDCLPSCLQDNIRETVNFVKKFSLENGFNCGNEDYIYHGQFEGLNLYMTLNIILKDLSICNLLYPKNVFLEDAIYNIEIIISYMAKCNYKSTYWCNTVKRKIK